MVGGEKDGTNHNHEQQWAHCSVCSSNQHATRLSDYSSTSQLASRVVILLRCVDPMDGGAESEVGARGEAPNKRSEEQELLLYEICAQTRCVCTVVVNAIGDCPATR